MLLSICDIIFVDEKGGENVDQMEELVTMVRQGFRDMNERFDKVEFRLDKVEQRLDNVGKRLDNIDDRMENIEKDMSYLSRGFGEHNMILNRLVN